MGKQFKISQKIRKTEQKKVVLIVGASGGIGLQTTALLTSCGYQVYASTRTSSTSQQLISIREKNKNINLLQMDITKDRSCRNAIEKILKEEKKIDILINCSGHVLFGPIDTITLKQAKDQFEVTIFGMKRLLNYILPIMKEQQSGQIICLGSTSGVESWPMYGMYSAAKFALEAMMFALAANVSPWNIKISIVELSAIATEICTRSFHFPKKIKTTQHKNYVSNSFRFLSEIIRKGDSPSLIASHIKSLIEQKDPPFRSMATKKAETIFSDQLKDPQGDRLKSIIRDEASWYL